MNDLEDRKECYETLCLSRYNFAIAIMNIQKQVDTYKIEPFNTSSWIEEVSWDPLLLWGAIDY